MLTKPQTQGNFSCAETSTENVDDWVITNDHLIVVFILGMFEGSNFKPAQVFFTVFNAYSTSIYLLNFNNRNTRTKCKICSKLTIKTPEQRHWCHSGIFIVNFELISDFVLVFLLLTLNM